MSRPSRIRRRSLLSWPILLLALLVPPLGAQAQPGGESIDILLVTGQSSRYHNWQVSHRIVERVLDETGLFDVDVITTEPEGRDLAGFAPRWDDYDAVVLDYDGDPWPAATMAAFERYLSAGGGLVLIHAADNAFPDWEAFQRMSAVGGWRGRTEEAGPKLRWRDGRAVLDSGPGVAQHPPQHDFRVVTRAPDHPVMQGLPEAWLQPNDELYSQLRGPAQDVTILATARADTTMPGGTGEHEPMLMTIQYGDGRVFHTTLGHVGPRDDESVATMRSVGFIVTLQRGTEWAATGRVTQPVPADFPAADRISLR